MHPIERLRYVARASHVPPDVLAKETAIALADFVGDDASLLIACKQILGRQPTSGVMVWLVAHILGAPNQRRALWDAVEQLRDDPIRASLGNALPDRATVCISGWSDIAADAIRKRGDVSVVVVDTDGSAYDLADRLIEAGHNAFAIPPEALGQAMSECTVLVVDLMALGPEQTLAPQGSLGAAAIARHWAVPVWGIASVGCALPNKLYDGLIRRWHEREQSPRWERDAEEMTVDLLTAVVGSDGLTTTADAQRDHRCPIVPELF